VGLGRGWGRVERGRPLAAARCAALGGMGGCFSGPYWAFAGAGAGGGDVTAVGAWRWRVARAVAGVGGGGCAGAKGALEYVVVVVS